MEVSSMTEYKIDISRSVRDIIDFYLERGRENDW